MKMKQKGITQIDFESEVSIIYDEIIRNPEVTEALLLLDLLPENLWYHNKEHTLDVLRETILFALADGVSREVIDTMAVAAAWHDVGYVERYENNESVAVDLFKKSKAFQNLSEEQRHEIISNILDTQMVINDGKPYLLQRKSKYGYVLDADVSNFGREDYFEKRSKVGQELGLDLLDIDVKKKFFSFAMELLRNQEWKTSSARLLRQSQKEKNLKTIQEEFERLH